MWLLDTDTISHAMRANPGVLDQLERAGQTPCMVSVLTVYELGFGIRRSPKPGPLATSLGAIQHLLQGLPIDHRIAHQAGRIRADLATQGRDIGPIAPLIAATALRHGLVLVTGSTGHFIHIDGLQLEDWIAR